MRIVSFVCVLLSLTSSAFGSCDFANDIKENPNGTYTYTKECHIEVGKRVKKLALVEEQVLQLEKTIELKDLALSKQRERADMWMDASLKINDKLVQYDAIASKDDKLYFLMGVGITILSVWAAGQLAP
jgi:hypothetical protein